MSGWTMAPMWVSPLAMSGKGQSRINGHGTMASKSRDNVAGGNYSDLSVFGDTEDNRIEWKTVQKQKNDLLSLIPLAGIKFQITPKLSISTEFRLAASTKKVKYHTEYLYKERGLTTSTSETTNYRRQSVDFRPYSGIYLAIVL